ncbi:MAG: orotidine-5'-phosphate decarboxylase [Anaerolineae bacterium]|nr:orotidine-5'-phosphate decarboxylase [Anaerolineae bacterium]
MGFWGKLESSAAQRDSLVCVGLDPVRESIPARYGGMGAFCRAIVDLTAEYACAYKPNIAFFEALGTAGLEALIDVIRHVPEDIPVILDAKRGDIANTARAYAQAVFERWGADAVTLMPYLGRDAIAPFLEYADKGVFVLCKTSNPSADELQEWEQDGVPLYRHVARLAQAWAQGRAIGLVAGATFPQALGAIRREAPDAWLLVPGVGAQGGDLEAAVAAGLRADGMGLLVNSSRGILYAEDPRRAALELRDRINAAKERPATGACTGIAGEQRIDRLAQALLEAGCVQFGRFTLHSGAISPIYVDLRRLVTFPRLLSQVARVYADMLAGLEYARIAAVPLAGLPIGTAVALQMGEPLIYPRGQAKSYGTRRAIEGEYVAGERVVLLDDLISSGGSKLEAIEPLREAGLVVQDVVVLIDREQGGREDLAGHGYRLHAALTLRDLVRSLERQGAVSAAQAQEVYAYLGHAEARS